ncbi:hypothetical protein E2C01_037342 [Portunus trituberculatus]|uniref:Uncharacterized protein n=1 Tax=Portunus trituberculatus TaxID=210409 RepID=A0A5B7F7W1_PORTR|nr:hypothetical protein [Portunus trituberculatus]
MDCHLNEAIPSFAQGAPEVKQTTLLDSCEKDQDGGEWLLEMKGGSPDSLDPPLQRGAELG